MSVPETGVMMQAMAAKDLNALRGMADPNIFADEIYGFHAQQAVEKMLKAWISLAGGSFGFIHDLERLLLELEQLGCDARRFEDLVELAPFAVQFRYEEMEREDVPLDRADILHRVEELYAHVQSLSGRNHPSP